MVNQSPISLYTTKSPRSSSPQHSSTTQQLGKTSTLYFPNMASTTCLPSLSSSASPFIGSKVSANQPRSPPPSRVSFRPFRVSAACASTAERPTSYIATPTSASSLYEVLGIQMGATCQEIKTAYRRLARTLHPDVAASGQREDTAYEFMRVHEAYETLSDPEKRADYDRSLYRRGRQTGSPFVMSAATVTTMATGYAAAGFSGYTSHRWETDQCW
ncbi:CHAPERONE PROTEIN DNAJ 11 CHLOROPLASTIC-LIKE [Salix viminalis]|uniref:CHAPERONE PROTEIN DNAJ 11 CHLOROPLASTIC-LIKE n=1 Tax=Salix viminalis TaxID=40686 RepID=A0A9Q0UJ42_SALVM|nr:CHAPERONE PROTEIN DNAJ 11 CHLOROPLASTIC-LIKE [Salix viminalis]